MCQKSAKFMYCTNIEWSHDFFQPVELLHKSLEEFVEEFKSLYDTDYSHHAVREVFQEHERQRLSEF